MMAQAYAEGYAASRVAQAGIAPVIFAMQYQG
jgi:hypothetical protein